MDNQATNLRELIRNFKNNLVQHYFQFRINTSKSPYKVRLRTKPYRILFILSHMRSGSSLLTHLLNSNPEIIGYGETHIQYSSELDFKKLMFKVYLQGREFNKLEHFNNFRMNHKYILDKVLHDHKFLDKSFLNSENIYIIFLVREPERSLNSIITLKPHWTQEKTLDYYCTRLSMLANYAEMVNSKQHSLFVTYDQLVNHTETVFNALKIFLGTEEGFSEQYEILRTTGMQGIGDSSENIKAGRIIKNARKLENKISQDRVEKGMECFNQCCAILTQYCTTVQ
ncbi:MAG TPA: sulfotransferase family protein [Cyanobacteria bacterium UBA12227]|nr:sulfotransferase family protein [Cyanobacteria bacterium UBA12227]HAX84716.1 sulfotransferase family protein [Cyanobacteria bacterium UBA11370]HBY77653.1 sulfotransferase family protein [Cyanobacteria bacterium UBA11148]